MYCETLLYLQYSSFEYHLKNQPPVAPTSQAVDAILVDLHAEATSEKRAFGFYADGRVSAVWGTHTHVGTSDSRLLPKGTAYRSDIGMTGLVDSVIGANKNAIIEQFLTQTGHKEMHDVAEDGEVELNAQLLDIEGGVVKEWKALYATVTL